jgi:hypothetical protein
MNETRLRELLREVPVPGAEEAERRSRAVVAAAFAQRPRERRAVLPRFAIAAAAAALLAILILSPAGAAVRGWIDDVFTTGAPNAEKALTRIPGGGRLLVQSQAGPWVVQPDGSRRLLGDYGEATWSPHGLYLAVARGRTLTAVEPGGTPHWSLSAAAAVSDPRWSPSGYRIAYRAGDALWVVHADGSADAVLAPRVAPIAPSWSPDGLPELTYVDARGKLVISDVNSGSRLAIAGALPGITQLEWGAGGVLVEASPSTIAVRQITLDKLTGTLQIGAPRRIGLPGRSRFTGVAVSPSGGTLAVLRRLNLATRSRAEVDLVRLQAHRTRRLFDTPGRLGQIAWSPDGSRLLITWPEANQWLFVPVQTRGRLKAVAGISSTFAPGTSGGTFPSVEGWCCRR